MLMGVKKSKATKKCYSLSKASGSIWNEHTELFGGDKESDGSLNSVK